MASEQWWKKDEASYSEWQELTTEDGLKYYFNTTTQETTWEKPEALMDEAEIAGRSNWVWYCDDDMEYYAAQIYGEQNGEKVLSLQDGREVRVDANEYLIPLKQSSLQRVVNDLTLLDDMNEPLILHCLHRRFDKQKIYTSIGGIIISMNPYVRIEGLYDRRNILHYRNSQEMHKKVEPHVFCPSHEAYAGLTFENGRNQSIIISGESGAGKTEAAKQCLSYIGAVAGSLAGIEQKVFEANPILEGFGNAKTIRNNNSSRFGKYVDIAFNDELMLCGAVTQNYLLEKIRVMQHGDGERNYHIFYFLTGGADRTLKEELCITKTSDYQICTMGGDTAIPGMNDRKEFEELQNAFKVLEFNDDDVMSTYKIIAAILNLGNVEFTEQSHSNQDATCTIDEDSMYYVQSAAYLLQINEETLAQALRTQKIVNTYKELNREASMKQRDSFCKFVYSKLFDWLVIKINMSMKPKVRVKKKIGILDIFGFEIFQTNSLEQLCINFCNEKLQNLFNKNVFEVEERAYREEQIGVDSVNYIDNTPILELIEKKKRPAGLFPRLDEELKKPGGSLQKYKAQIDDAFATHPNYKSGRRPLEFTITHYAGPVHYTADGFLKKNQDSLSKDLADLAAECQLPLMDTLFGRSAGMSAKSRKMTLSAQFTKQLGKLMETLFATQSHYIRCVKPNEHKEAFSFTSKMVLEQLTYSGVFQAVEIRKNGFPFRLSYAEFVKRYSCILEDAGQRVPKGKKGAEKIIEFVRLNPENTRMGKTKAFYRAEEHSMLELKRSIIVEQRKMAETLREILNTNINSLPDVEVFYGRVGMVVRSCNRYNIHTPDAEEVRDLLENFIMERMDPETRVLLEEAIEEKNLEKLVYVCEVIEENDYQTTKCQLAVRLRDRLYRIIEEAEQAIMTYEASQMKACLAAADEIGFSSDSIERFRELLAMGENSESFLQAQIRQAVAVGDTKRQISLQVKLKNRMFENNDAILSMFDIMNFPGLKDPDDWGREKWTQMFGGNLHTTMMIWTADAIHSNLCTTVDKSLKKTCVENFKNIQYYCSDRPVPAGQNAEEYGLAVLSLGITNAAVRDEIYCQLVKQTRMNQNSYSHQQCWKLVNLCLYCFPPSTSLENYLEVFIRLNSGDNKDDTLRNLRTTLYTSETCLSHPPSLQDMRDIAQGLRPRVNFLETPPESPSWTDLLRSFDDENTALDTYAAPLPGSSAQLPKSTSLMRKPSNARARLASMQQPPKPPMFVAPGGPTTNVSSKKKKAAAALVPPAAPGGGGPPPAPVPAIPPPAPGGPPAAPGAAAPAEAAWQAHLDVESGDLYFFNEQTEVTQWEKPNEPIKPFWIAYFDSNAGEFYYEEKVAGTTTWDEPEEYFDENETFQAIKDLQSGEYYYENLESGDVTWDSPECFQGAGAAAEEWIRHFSKEHKMFYYQNTRTDAVTWDEPANWTIA